MRPKMVLSAVLRADDSVALMGYRVRYSDLPVSAPPKREFPVYDDPPSSGPLPEPSFTVSVGGDGSRFESQTQDYFYSVRRELPLDLSGYEGTHMAAWVDLEIQFPAWEVTTLQEILWDTRGCVATALKCNRQGLLEDDVPEGYVIRLHAGYNHRCSARTWNRFVHDLDRWYPNIHAKSKLGLVRRLLINGIVALMRATKHPHERRLPHRFLRSCLARVL